MQNLTSSDYFTECKNTASLIVELAIEGLQYDGEEVTEESVNDRIFDYVLHETIDSHEYVIYNAYHLPILQYSNNDSYMVDHLGSDCVAYELENNGLSGLNMALAFWAFYGDVCEHISYEVEKQIEALEEGEDDNV